MIINNAEYQIHGNFIKTIRIKNEFIEYINEPEAVVASLSEMATDADIFSFIQKVPDNEPKYNYKMEWQSVAIIPIISYNYWFEHQIKRNARKAIRNSIRKGVVIKQVGYNDEFVYAILEIFNETPIRQGRAYPHFGKDFNSIKTEFAQSLDKCVFIGAYYNEELIGFIKLYLDDNFSIPFGMVSKLIHRDKNPQNALIGKAIQITADKGIPYLYYGNWAEDSLTEFKKHIGCQKMDLPRYFIPLSPKGKILIVIGLHKGFLNLLPADVLKWLKIIKYYVSLLSKINAKS